MTERSVLSIPSPPLPYFLESGKTHYMPGESHPNRRNLGVYDLILVQCGRLFLGEEDMQWALGAGDCVVLLPDAYHYAVQECQEETSFYWLHFSDCGIKRDRR